MDLLFFILFLVVFILSGGGVLLLHYYRRIFFPGKEQYGRSELVDIQKIIPDEFFQVLKGKAKGKGKGFEANSAYLVLILSALAGFMITFTGGIYGYHYTSYFFHSALIPAILYLILGYLKSLSPDSAPAMIGRLMQYDFLVFLGFSISLLAKGVSVFFAYRSFNFIFFLVNTVLVIAIILIRIQEHEKDQDYRLLIKLGLADNNKG